MEGRRLVVSVIGPCTLILWQLEVVCSFETLVARADNPQVAAARVGQYEELLAPDRNLHIIEDPRFCERK